MAEPLVFQSQWVIQIREMLNNDEENSGANNDENGRVKADAILRVATPLLNMKPEAYIPQFLSIGPYHHSKLEKDIESSCAEHKISTAETYKGKTVARLSQKLRKRGKSFESIVEMMERMRPDIENFYHWSPITDAGNSQNFALMMAVDSSFLLHFLISLSRSRDQPHIRSNARSGHDEEKHANDHRPATASSSSSSSPSPSRSPDPSSDDDMIELGPLHVCIKCDILKLENQIPLFVVEEVFENMKEILGHQELNELLQATSMELSPFSPYVYNKDAEPISINAKMHLLGWMHEFVEPFLQITKKEDKPTALQILKMILEFPVIVVSHFLPTPKFERSCEIALNAEKLAKAGIKFKPFSKQPYKIRFDRYSGTLYLPRINIWEIHTEVFLRNMVALEFSDTSRGNTVMRYVSLMDCLIQTPEDVRVLRDRRVISANTLTDEYIAKMWNDLGQPFFTGHLGPDSNDLSRGLFHALWIKYRKSKIKRMLLGLFDYVSSWKFYAPVAGFLALALTVIQTYCSLYSMYHAPPSAPAYKPPH